MGTTINGKTEKIDILLRSTLPIIFCSPIVAMEKAITKADIQPISLNIPLSKVLISKRTSLRCESVVDDALELIPVNKPVYLTDYEMLFDPRYNVDVIRFFLEISRRNKLIIKWCGSIVENTLIYATPDYEDYKRYKVKDYEIICVI